MPHRIKDSRAFISQKSFISLRENINNSIKEFSNKDRNNKAVVESGDYSYNDHKGNIGLKVEKRGRAIKKIGDRFKKN
jgi:hypothetical protein